MHKLWAGMLAHWRSPQLPDVQRASKITARKCQKKTPSWQHLCTRRDWRGKLWFCLREGPLHFQPGLRSIQVIASYAVRGTKKIKKWGRKLDNVLHAGLQSPFNHSINECQNCGDVKEVERLKKIAITRSPSWYHCVTQVTVCGTTRADAWLCRWQPPRVVRLQLVSCNTPSSVQEVAVSLSSMLQYRLSANLLVESCKICKTSILCNYHLSIILIVVAPVLGTFQTLTYCYEDFESPITCTHWKHSWLELLRMAFGLESFGVIS